MKIKIIIFVAALCFAATHPCLSQDVLNKTDQRGLKQGHWIKKYPNQVVMYDGFFRDGKPVGEFKRYYENNKRRSVLIYNEDGSEAEALIYHPSGFISSKGKYVNQMKEGKWQFYSPEEEGYLICEEHYSGNIKDGISVKFYPDNKIAEKINYIRGVKNGEWIQYFQNGRTWIKSGYLNGRLNGKYEVWFENGKLSFSGQYKSDARDGSWIIYNRDGSVKYKIEYKNGYTEDRQVDIDESEYLDSLERNRGNVTDPEKAGEMW